MQCLVLAGGLGTRMKKASGGLPKALLPVGNRAFLDWQLEWLKLHGIQEVVVALGVGADQIRAYLKEARLNGPKILFSEDGPDPLGTGGAIRKALPLLQDDFFVTYGDTLLFLDLSKMRQAHRKSGFGVTLSILRNRNQGDRSNIQFEKGQIVKYDKFNPDSEMDYIDYGMSLVKKAYFSEKSRSEKFDYAEFISQACLEKQLGAVVVRQPFLEVGSSSGYHALCQRMAASGFDLTQLKASIE